MHAGVPFFLCIVHGHFENDDLHDSMDISSTSKWQTTVGQSCTHSSVPSVVQLEAMFSNLALTGGLLGVMRREKSYVTLRWVRPMNRGCYSSCIYPDCDNVRNLNLRTLHM